MSERGFGHIYCRNGIYWIKYHRNGEAFYESSRSRVKEDAKKLLKARINQKYRTSTVTVGELLDDVLTFYRVHRPKSYSKFARPVIEAALQPYWSRYTVEQVTTAKITAYQAKRKGKGAADATVNRELALLRRAFRLGAEATPPKVAIIPKFKLLAENNTRTGFMSHDQYHALRDALPEELRPLFVVAYHTGVRRGELLKIRWSQVDLNAREIRLRREETKSDRPRTLPIYGDMVDVLTEHKKFTHESWPRCQLVFHRAGRPIRDFRRSWAIACDAVGMPELLFHDLRRTAVRNMVRAGISERVAREISGHRTRAVFERYDIVDGRDILDAGEKLSKFLNG